MHLSAMQLSGVNKKAHAAKLLESLGNRTLCYIFSLVRANMPIDFFSALLL
ncbi:uncharacterized protein TrAFT101_003389 [Trichoderma asperellum]|uniref:uncharacterized protein n=1 Tax=Trichoderma asperellum TaxID=101201 RepID=UPI0033172283|nr:hypothetical protein TrAFT101_003389 [Trichoderma asperellum]